MPNYKLTIAYDGTSLLGWQRTQMGRSVEGELGKVLQTIFQVPVKLQASSRTDSGVHALGQVVNVHLDADAELAFLSINQLLPDDISLLKIEQVSDDFHPSLDVVSKEYHYRLRTSTFEIPQERHLVWHFPYRLNISQMRQEALKLLGTHDFSAFCNVKINDPEANFVRTVTDITITEVSEDELLFKIIGTSFLYKMVRNIVGTLAHIGCGKLPPDSISTLLEGKDRRKAGVTAPAHGLTLFRLKF
jgi:tRNA pseudouridine38-40 synthase